ncbi:hypothetical protein A3F00_04345 [Candidatus Daviesbacteria bacterium RIFCSPHIGHO2_12_FULL_37_11]|uniref:Uncharacterized protein n=1 Tax=Candidatus Daviesbacteria bacterium RIFCSPHIGHO2_12_FULL_37_11 TaxID=1797777 RepID=A0A1F5KA20_9BACT|nr:MAG: hypothetical protein A2111_01930 [Candidatus Daviesbacteria bacterium GWA1_38_6]OGE16131.1 MAG: hypothetical protein A2769_03515 [Candidatus Daviesbacteria bacterium RIFCSPHIGHO2_01_FULL_37_27]OGE37655.1 MAG: hypothetical protein A3F00_04345 [Candidatus Daviesbacteria bacterium RIFCSPHIGHO2_12_FULL_37_11]OGE45411.1 MAG: hypothetical protein A3B39_04745 [Candidatus Daviesbacteria bacterium RIFCSPLOWO2_01_FULL_37_10]
MSEVIRQSYFEIANNQFVDRGKSTVIAEKGSDRFLKRLGLGFTVMVGCAAVTGYLGTLIGATILGLPKEPFFGLETPPEIISDRELLKLTLFTITSTFGGMFVSFPVSDRLEKVLGISRDY